MTDVSDPTDFGHPTLPSTVPAAVFQPLSSIDALLRCRVCKDLFVTPMITSCSHTFCSLCIRRCLSADGRCPVCRAQDQEMRLRRNWAIEEMVEGWKTGRQGVLDGLKTLTKTTSRDDSLNGERRTKRRKLDPEAEPNGESFSGRTTRSRARRVNGSSQGQEPSLSQISEVIDDSEAGSSYEEGQSPRIAPVLAPSDGLVPCPGCSKRMKEEAVFSHLDRCTGLDSFTPSPPPERPKSRTPVVSMVTNQKPTPTTSEERLPTINYNLLNEKNLRKKLKDLGIPDWGVKPLLIRRHTEWVNLWNANCDSRRPRSKRELLHELDVWERTQGGNAPGSGGPNMFGNGSNSNTTNVGEKGFDKNEWSRSHQDDFKTLIRQAREKRNAANTTEPQEPNPAVSAAADEPNTTSALPVQSTQMNGNVTQGSSGVNLTTTADQPPRDQIVSAEWLEGRSHEAISSGTDAPQEETVAAISSQGGPRRPGRAFL